MINISFPPLCGYFVGIRLTVGFIPVVVGDFLFEGSVIICNDVTSVDERGSNNKRPYVICRHIFTTPYLLCMMADGMEVTMISQTMFIYTNALLD